MKCMMACCREDNSCVENSNGQEGFGNGHILSVITAQTIGKPTAVPFPASSTLHTSIQHSVLNLYVCAMHVTAENGYGL